MNTVPQGTKKLDKEHCTLTTEYVILFYDSYKHSKGRKEDCMYKKMIETLIDARIDRFCVDCPDINWFNVGKKEIQNCKQAKSFDDYTMTFECSVENETTDNYLFVGYIDFAGVSLTGYYHYGTFKTIF